MVGRGRRTVVYPLISTEDGRAVEMVPPAGYVSAKNPSLAKETLRRWLLGRRGARRWSPGFAVVSSGDPTARTGLDAALDTLHAHDLLGAPVEAGAVVKRYHVLNGGKAIVSVGEGPGRYGTHIVVLVRSPEYVARRRHEGGLLVRLAGLPAEIAGQIPRFCYEEETPGAHVFVLQEFPGVTLDAPAAGLPVATRDAADFIRRLHLATRRATRLTRGRFDAVLGGALETARARYPTLAGTLDRLETALRGRLEGAEVPLVWMHGDFKIENVVVEERSSRLLGVIDWELSEPEGLPLLDLWYLLLYNRMIERGLDFLTVARDVLPPRQLGGEAAAVCGEYRRALEVPSRLVPALAGALILHHAARRMDMDPNDQQEMSKLRGLLEEAARWIESGGAGLDG
jgi:aminoglycoside phosphotransferase (APT) family kinase protein